MANYIIDPVNDSQYYEEVRDLLGITIEDLNDDILKSDIILGAAERMICKVYVPNWQDILTGSDPIAADALRSLVVVRVAMNILNMPASQNILFDQVKFIDMVVTAKKQSIEEIKMALQSFFEDQLPIIGIIYSDGWPERSLIGKSDSANVFDYYIDSEGNVQEQ